LRSSTKAQSKRMQSSARPSSIFVTSTAEMQRL